MSSTDNPFVVQPRSASRYNTRIEFIVISAIIIVALIYLILFYVFAGSSTPERFGPGRYIYDRRSSAQAHYVVDDRPGHDGTRNDIALGSLATFTPGTVIPGNRIGLKGPSTAKFIDFAAVDAIDKLQSGESEPSHKPETPDQDLEKVIRSD